MNSEKVSVELLSLEIMAGTGYICRVMYGVFNDANVYLYSSEDGWSVATYNGTTENPVEPCD